MGNLFSTSAYYGKIHSGPITMSQWKNQMDKYTRELAEQKQLLAKINRGELPTNLRAIDFDNEHYCSLNSKCNERKIPKRQLMALYKRKTIEYIKLTEQSIAEHMAKKPTETPGRRQPQRQPQKRPQRQPQRQVRRIPAPPTPQRSRAQSQSRRK